MNGKTLAALSVGLIASGLVGGFTAGQLVTDDGTTTADAQTNSTIANMEANAPEPGGSCGLSVNVRPADGERVIIEESHGSMGVVDTSAFTQPTSFGKSLMRGSNVTVYAANLTDESVTLLNESRVTEDCTLAEKTEE